MVRAWAKTETEADPGLIARILGDEKKKEAGRGSFLDAIPVAPVRLEADVMTPHYAGWDAQDPPGDWRSPVPIPFLTMAPGVRFWFGLVPCGDLEEGDLDVAWKWMVEALQWAGAGAKTAVGYGRFRWVPEATEARQREQEKKEADRRQREKEEIEKQEAMKTPEGRWAWKLREMTEQQVLDAVRKNLEKKELTDPTERAAFARAVLKTDYVNAWRKGRVLRPGGAPVGKKKIKERMRLLEEAAGESPPEGKA